MEMNNILLYIQNQRKYEKKDVKHTNAFPYQMSLYIWTLNSFGLFPLLLSIYSFIHSFTESTTILIVHIETKFDRLSVVL